MKNIKVFTSSTCPYCTLAKDYLDEKGVEYEEKNITTDGDARQELIDLGHTGVPVIVVDDVEVVGFDKGRIDQLLDD